MASAELASTSSVGPRYAPDDPTLPRPWRVLIDGSTGLLYYWNPESNVTQYDRPTSFNPPLPPGPPPCASTPKLTPISLAVTQTTDVSGAQQHGQPVVQQQLSVAQQMAPQNFQQLTYQHTQPIVNQQPQQPYPQQLPHLQYPQVTYLQGQLGGQTRAPEHQQQGSQVPIQQHQGIDGPYQQQQGSQGSYPQHQRQQVAEVQYLLQQLQGSQVPDQQQQPQQLRIPFPIGQQQEQLQREKEQLQREKGQQQPERQQSSVYHQAKEPQNQQIAAHRQGQQIGIPRIEEPERQEGKQAGYSLSQVQENDLMSSNYQLSSIATQAQVSNRAKLVQSQQQQQQYAGPTSSGQQFGGLSSSGLQFGGAPGGQQISGTLGAPKFSGAPGDQQFGGLSDGQQFGVPFASSQQFSGLSSGGKQSVGQLAGVSSFQLQQDRMDIGYRQPQIGSHMVPTQAAQSIAHSVGSQMEHEEDWRERLGNEFYSSRRNYGLMMLAQWPELAPPPLVRNPQETRISAVNPHFISPGHLGSSNIVPGHAMPNMQNHAPFPSASPIRPPSRMFDSPEFTGINVAKAYREHHEVTAVGDNVPAPFMTFEATGFPPEILRELHLAGFWPPTPIQAQTWPVALRSRDIVAIARTGSGKTLGYLIPAFIHLRRCRNNPHFGPTVLVLAPTRELATQIQDEAIKFGHSSRVSCTCLYGGSPKGPQLREIERGADIIVATPGRLNDILEMKKINFRQISLLVLDEADCMLDMGFEPQIRKIVNEIPPCRQTLMYTATWPKEVRKIAGDLLVNPVQVTIGSVDELAANKSITQFVEVVHPSDRQLRLEEILRSQEQGSKIIIFCSTKKLCDDLVHNFGRHFRAASIHGDKSQGERDHALHQFRCGRAPILVATEIAARGLDIKDIRVVINYDFPTGIEDYVHRIGRTGRAGVTGVSYTFFSGQDWKHAAELIKVLEGANQWVPPELREMAARGGPAAFPHAPSHGGMSHWDSSGDPGSGRWDSSGGCGYRDRWDSRGGRGDGGQFDIGGGRGNGMRDSVGGQDFAGRGGGGRNDFYGDRGIARGHGFHGPGGRGRHDRGSHERYYNYPDARGRYDRDNRRGYGERSRGRSYSRSPEKVRSRGYDRSRSDSRSRNRNRRSLSRSRSQSRSPSRSRSRSWSYDRYNRVPRSLFTDAPDLAATAGGSGATRFEAPTLFTNVPAMVAAAVGGNGTPGFEAPDVFGFKDASLSGHMSPMSPGRSNGLFSRNEIPDRVAMADGGSLGFSRTEPASEPGRLLRGV